MGNYIVGINGDAASFSKLNEAAAGFADIIKNSEHVKFAFAASADKLAIIDSKGNPYTLAEQHAAGAAGRDSSLRLWVYVLRPSECCTDVPASKFQGVSWLGGLLRDFVGLGVKADLGTEAGHEFGHASYKMGIGRGSKGGPANSNDAALKLENAVRKVRDPNAPVRTVH